MAVPAAVPLLILKRRKVGGLAVTLGVVLVALGFFLPLTTTSATHVPPLPGRDGLVLLTAGNASGFSILGTVFNHPLLSSGGFGGMLVDLASRGGVVLIALAAVLCVAFNVLPMMRGMVGVAAGVGLMGTAIEAGVILGEGGRIRTLCDTVASCGVDLHAGIALIAVGFVVAMVGGAVGALRPLAGLIGGMSFALTGAALGAGAYFLVTEVRVLDIAASVLQVLQHRR